MKPTPLARKAEQDMRHFEQAGKTVVGVTILTDGYKLDFAAGDERAVDQTDLVNMGEK